MISVRICECANGFIVDVVDSEAELEKEKQTKVYEFGNEAEMFEQLAFTLGVHDAIYQSTNDDKPTEAPPEKNLIPTEDLI
jgi:hypothetical protein